MLPIHPFMHSDGIVSCPSFSVRSMVIVGGHPAPIGDKEKECRQREAGRDRLPPNSHCPVEQKHSPIHHQLWAPLTPKWAFKAGHPSTEKWSPGISAPMPVPPGKSGKLKPHPLMWSRSIYTGLHKMSLNFRFHPREDQIQSGDELNRY